MFGAATAVFAKSSQAQGKGAISIQGAGATLLSVATGTSDTNSTGDHQGQDQNETQPSDSAGDNETDVGSGVENDTSGLQDDQNLNGTNELHFALVPVNSSVSGHGDSGLEFEGLDLSADAEVEGARTNATYTFVLTINGTTHSLGTLVTNQQGEGEIEAELGLPSPGVYSFSVSLKLGSLPDLTGSPSVQTATLGNSSSSEDHQGDQGGDNQQGDSVAAIQLGQFGQGQLSQAQASNQIPGYITFDGSSAQVTVNDPRFSLSAGTYQGSGISISISGSNVVGSRVLLVGLPSSLGGSSQRLLVTFDGTRVTKASSLSEVLESTSSDQPTYLVANTAAGLALLISIPHFSTHTISILPITAALGGILTLNGLTMFLSMSAIGVAIFAAYTRRRVYSPLA